MEKGNDPQLMARRSGKITYSFERREPRDRDIVINIQYCGYVIQILTRIVMNGADQCFLWFQGMRSHELSPKLVQKLVFTTWGESRRGLLR